MGQVEDVAQCVSMDLKRAGNQLLLVGATSNEMGGSHWGFVSGRPGGSPPAVDTAAALTTYQQLHQAIKAGAVRSCHDLSEGGLAAAIAEMAIAGRCGADINIADVPLEEAADAAQATMVKLFAESNSRLLVEIESEKVDEFKSHMKSVPLTHLGRVVDGESLVVRDGEAVLMDVSVEQLTTAWKSPLDWHGSS